VGVCGGHPEPQRGGKKGGKKRGPGGTFPPTAGRGGPGPLFAPLVLKPIPFGGAGWIKKVVSRGAQGGGGGGGGNTGGPWANLFCKKIRFQNVGLKKKNDFFQMGGRGGRRRWFGTVRGGETLGKKILGGGGLGPIGAKKKPTPQQKKKKNKKKNQGDGPGGGCLIIKNKKKRLEFLIFFFLSNV